jgi:hypothetical protein
MYKISINLKCSKTLNKSADQSEQEVKGTYRMEGYEPLQPA